MHDPEMMVADLRWIEIWHHEPGGHDAGTICDRHRQAWHPHHWRLNSPPLHTLRRRLLTRCTWCGGRSRKGDAVNHARGWRDNRGPWWRGEADLYHGDCLSMQTAHRTCLCDSPLLEHADYGKCLICGKYRAWRKEPSDLDRAMAALPTGSRRPQWITDELHRRYAERRKAEQ